MKALLDTHIILWALTEDKKLPQKAKEIISRRDIEIYYSTALYGRMYSFCIIATEKMNMQNRWKSDVQNTTQTIRRKKWIR